MSIQQRPLLIPLFPLIECLITATAPQYLGGLLVHVFLSSLEGPEFQKGTRIKFFPASLNSKLEGPDFHKGTRIETFRTNNTQYIMYRKFLAQLVLLQRVISCLFYVDLPCHLRRRGNYFALYSINKVYQVYESLHSQKCMNVKAKLSNNVCNSIMLWSPWVLNIVWKAMNFTVLPKNYFSIL